MGNMKKKTLKEKAYNFVKNKIVNCEYPPNAFINEEMIAQEMNASRTPIREALNRLEQEQLVKIMPKKGIIVCELTPDVISSIFETRLLIEPFIIENYGHLIDREKLKDYKKIYEGDFQDDEAEFEIDDSFHSFLYNSSKNVYLIKTLENTTWQNQRIRVYSGIKVRRVPRTHEEHLKIIDAILSEKYSQAADQMREHIKKSMKNSLEIVYSSFSRF